MVSIISQNVRGLRDRVKRRSVFRHFHTMYPDYITVMQETHSSLEDEKTWKMEWGSEIIFSHGSAHQAGTAILLPRRYNGAVKEKCIDSEGRIVSIKVLIGGGMVTIIGVYAPAIDTQYHKINFLNELRETMIKMIDEHSIVAGDFNIHLAPLDAEINKYRRTLASQKLTELLEEFFLIDIWRAKNPSKREYTWRRGNPMSQSRIDYVFINEAMRQNFNIDVNIALGISSDHSAVLMVAVPKGKERGPGVWKYNNSLHECDNEFITLVRSEISRFSRGGRYNATPMVNIGVRLEMLFSAIRQISIRRGKARALVARKEEIELTQQVHNFERDLSKLSEQQINSYQCARQRLEELQRNKGHHAILASGSNWLEMGEKVNRYFLSRGKQLSAQKTITEIDNDGEMIRDNKEILSHCVNYYSKIYSSKGINHGMMTAFIGGVNVPKLSDEERAQCEGPISNDECKFALSKMNKNKAPGVSGFSVEFLSFFWQDIGSIIVMYINDAFHNGWFITQRRGFITLVPKKGATNLLQNKRPICLLDVVYKLAAKVIALRIQNVISKLVAPEQTGFIKGRFIGDNIRLASDIITYCEADKIEGLMVACDYRQAFDSLEHEFIFAAMRAYNFGDDMIQWIKLLYSEAYLAIINNGFTSSWFKCTSGTFQGSPASGLIFALALEILAIRIRENTNIKGILVDGVETKLSLYADDMILYTADKISAETAIQTIKQFGEISGLWLNERKSSLMWLGAAKERTDSTYLRDSS